MTPDIQWKNDIYLNNASTVVDIFDRTVGKGVSTSVADGHVNSLEPLKDLPVKILRHDANGYPSIPHYRALTGCCGPVSAPSIRRKLY